ncbi:hypothetical protein FRB99_002310 [Tulasnella sp. 403]|nr:hypothetical protein FRB99_002310 [Tulasnella sp. 403]
MADPTGVNQLMQKVLQDAAHNLEKLFETDLADLRTQNTDLRQENVNLRDEVKSLNGQIEQLKQTMRRQEEYPGMEMENSFAAFRKDYPYDQELMLKLLDASDQVIKTKEEIRKLEIQNGHLEKERDSHRTSLKAVEAAWDEALAEVKKRDEQLEAIQSELAKREAENNQLHSRLNDEVKIYEKSLKGKQKVISELEGQVAVLKKAQMSNKENVQLGSDATSNGVTPLQDVTSNVPDVPPSKTLDGRYVALAKRYKLLEDKYDKLHKLHNDSLAKFHASRERWATYKRQVQKGLARINDAHSSSSKKHPGTLGTGPAPSLPNRDGELGAVEVATPTSRKTLRAALVTEWKVNLEQMDAEDRAMMESLPPMQGNPSATLHQEGGQVVDPHSAPHDHVAPAALIPPHRAYSPTISEEPLSQLPATRLRELDSDPPIPERDHGVQEIGEIDPVTAGPMEARGPALGSFNHSRGTSLIPPPPPPEKVIPQTATSGDSPGPSNVSLRMERQSASSGRAHVNPRPKINQLEAAFFVKPEPVDDLVLLSSREDVSRPVTPRPLYSGPNGKAPIRAKSSPPSSPSRVPAPETTTASVLGKRKTPRNYPEPSDPPVGTRSVDRPPNTARPANSDPNDYSRYKGRGRYAQAARSNAQDISAIYEIDRSRNGGLSHVYDAVVRNKKQRRQMDATDCECCKGYYDAVGYLPPINRGPRWRSPSPNPLSSKGECPHHGAESVGMVRSNSDSFLAASSRETEQRRGHMKEISRHRHEWAPPATPPDYWHIGFPDTQQIDSINRRAEAHYQAKRAQIEHEASTIPVENIDAVFNYLIPIFEYLFLAPATVTDGQEAYPTLDFKHHTAVYTLVYNVITSSRKLENSPTFYSRLEGYADEPIGKIKAQIFPNGPGVPVAQYLPAYLTAWTRFNNRATNVHRVLSYFNRHWVKREEDEGRGARIADLTKWGYPLEADVDKESAEMCAKAASDATILPVRALFLRKWRLLVVGDLNLSEIVTHVQSLEEEEKKKLAKEVYSSFWTVGVDPTKDEMVVLKEIFNPAPPAAAPAETPASETAPAADATATEGQNAELFVNRDDRINAVTSSFRDLCPYASLMGISIWLIPAAEAFQPLEDLIATLSAKYDSPMFQPHITVLSLPSNKSISIDSILPPETEFPPAFDVTFSKVCTGRTYFQSVLIELELDSTGPLQKLYERILEWNASNLIHKDEETSDGSHPVKPSRRPYYPHISLYYGDIAMDAKESIITELIGECRVKQKGDNGTFTTVAGVENGLRVNEMWVVLTEGPVEGWNVLKKVPLKPGASQP